MSLAVGFFGTVSATNFLTFPAILITNSSNIDAARPAIG
jgi:hypothetical protein